MKNHHEHRGGSYSKRALLTAISATTAILVIETAGGLWTNSLALLSDAAHVFMDLLSFVLAWLAIVLAERPVSDRRTFGWHRMEVFAAAINGGTVFVMAFFILAGAVRRIASPEDILGPPMMTIAIAGLVVNLFVIWKLHPHSREDLNVRGAFLHALGDAAASLAVIAGGVVFLKTGNALADSLAAVAVAFLILAGALRLLRDSVHILLEGMPRGIERAQVVEAIEKISGPRSVTDLHVWNLCSHLCALSVHLVLPEERMDRQKVVLQDVQSNLEKEFSIVHSTVQIESESWREKSSPKGEPHG